MTDTNLQVILTVIAADHPDYAVGDLVMGRQGWQRFAVSDGADIVRKLDPDLAPVETALGPLGINGVTAYVGLVEICAPKPGETVVVTTSSKMEKFICEM